jgi:gamma-glutamylcyclotransferase (GGCT)/AIG2-like uncharacterized protein YtfP
MPSITGAPWDDEEETTWSDLMTESLSRDDVDRVLGRPKTKREEKYLENDVNLLVQLDRRITKKTPDFLQLKLQDFIPVIVYGTLKYEGLYHDILKDAPFVGVGQTVEPKFIMMETQSFPVVFEADMHNKDERNKKGKIRGEVYMVDAKTMLRLDELEANGSMYSRKKTWVKLMDQGMSGVLPSIEAWIYIGHRDFFKARYLNKVKATHNGQHLVFDWDQTQTVMYG